MEIECEACGIKFITNNKLRRYCDECGENGHGLQKKISYDNASNRNRRRYNEPQIYEWECLKCKKKFKAPYKYVCHKEYGGIDEEDKIFCSKKCHSEYLREKQTCKECGESLFEHAMTGYDPFDESTHFCSNECSHKNYIDEMEKRGWIHTCEHCGKVFIRNGGYFCCRDCATIARKNGWTKPKTVSKDDKWFQ